MLSRSLLFLLAAAAPSGALADDTAWRCTTIEVCEGRSCSPDISSFAVFERATPPSVRAVLSGDGFSLPFASESEGLLDDAPYAERRYMERDSDARPTTVLTLRNPSASGVSISIYWPNADVATSREIIGRCERL